MAVLNFFAFSKIIIIVHNHDRLCVTQTAPKSTSFFCSTSFSTSLYPAPSESRSECACLPLAGTYWLDSAGPFRFHLCLLWKPRMTSTMPHCDLMLEKGIIKKRGARHILKAFHVVLQCWGHCVILKSRLEVLHINREEWVTLACSEFWRTWWFIILEDMPSCVSWS